MIRKLFTFLAAAALFCGVTQAQYLPLGGIVISSGGVPSPVLFQHIAQSTNPTGLGIGGRAFKINTESLPAKTVAVLAITAPHGTTFTISDTLAGTWAAAQCSADAGVGNYITAVFVQYLGATGGVDTVTLGVGTTNILPVQFDMTFWENINTTTPAGGHLCTANITPTAGAVISPGSFTPTNNNANGGNVIWNNNALCGAAGGNPTGWTAATNFSLLNGDIIWTGAQGFPDATQYWTQTTAASVTPSITSTGDTVDCFNSVSVALAVANNSASAPSTIHVVSILHEGDNNFVSPGNLKIQTPFYGNLRVIGFTWNGMSPGAGAGSITSITSSDGCNFTSTGTGGDAHIWYAQNCSSCPTCTVTTTWTGTYSTPQFSFRVYDIQNAATSSFQNGAGNTGTCGTTLSNAPTITPSGASSGLMIAQLGNGNGPVTAVTSPSGAVFDLWTFTGQTDFDMADNADASSHFYYSSTAAQNWNYTKTNGADSCYWWAAAFN